jgi:ABC-type phosphate/phosphonate transport system substrate-binding protein
MYAVTPASTAAWAALFDWVARRADVPLAWTPHLPPARLSDLWARDDLGAVLMCGLPLAHRAVPPQILAQPVSSLARYTGRAVYRTDLVVRADSPLRSLRDTFGLRAGYTLKDSQSGYYAFRHHLLTHHPEVPQPYAQVVGGLVNARGVIEALADGRIDVGPLNSVVHDLLREGDPRFAAQVRTVESTEPTPMPPIVASAALDAACVARLRAAFKAAIVEPALSATRTALLLQDFALPLPAVYDDVLRRSAEVDAAPPWP